MSKVSFHSEETGATYSFEMESWPVSFFHYVAFLRSMGYIVKGSDFSYSNTTDLGSALGVRTLSFRADEALDLAATANWRDDSKRLHPTCPPFEGPVVGFGGVVPQDCSTVAEAERGNEVYEWRENKGDFPDWLNPEDIVEIELRSGLGTKGPASLWYWGLAEPAESGQILRYRLVKRHHDDPPSPNGTR